MSSAAMPLASSRWKQLAGSGLSCATCLPRRRRGTALRASAPPRHSNPANAYRRHPPSLRHTSVSPVELVARKGHGPWLALG
jgi:hypothetical protein